jgi:hypothetical protein
MAWITRSLAWAVGIRLVTVLATRARLAAKAYPSIMTESVPCSSMGDSAFGPVVCQRDEPGHKIHTCVVWSGESMTIIQWVSPDDPPLTVVA